MSADLVIAHLYPDLLRTYGDRGNVLVLQHRAEWRGFSVRVVGVSRGDPIPQADLIFLGGGADRAQEAVAEDLSRRRSELADAVGGGSVLLGVCAGYQLLGTSYDPVTGPSIGGLGLLDTRTVSGSGRLIGRIYARGELDGRPIDLVGFENHGGRTHLGPEAAPLANVVRGFGNNGDDGGEGAVQGNVVGTYLHGPVLVTNPGLADVLLARALTRRTGGKALAPLDDALEDAAHDGAVRAATRERRRRSGRASRRLGSGV